MPPSRPSRRSNSSLPSEPPTIEIEGDIWHQLIVPPARIDKVEIGHAHGNATTNGDAECLGWQDVYSSTKLLTQLRLIPFDGDHLLPSPSSDEDQHYIGSFGPAVVALRTNQHRIFFLEQQPKQFTVVQLEAQLRRYFAPSINESVPATAAATQVASSSNASSETITLAPVGAVDLSSATQPRSNNSSMTSSNAKEERETAFWLTVERIALGLKHDVEMSQQQAQAVDLNGSSKNSTLSASSLDSSFSGTSGGSSSFTLTAHISSTLHQLIHLHYESMELESRIENCRGQIQKHTEEVEGKGKKIMQAIEGQTRQQREQMTEEERQLIDQIAQILQPNSAPVARSSGPATTQPVRHQPSYSAMDLRELSVPHQSNRQHTHVPAMSVDI